MFLKRVIINTIRNIQHITLPCQKGLTVFTGSNAQGKTNILESLYLLSHARSFRDAKNEHLIAFGKEFGSIDGLVDVGGHEVLLRVVVQKGTRTAFIDGKKCSRLSELAGYVHFVTFTVTDLQTINSTPSQRRNLLNKIVFNLYPGYIHLLREYERALFQRNHILTLLRRKERRKDDLAIWDQQLVRYGSQVYYYRMRIINSLNMILPQKYSMLTAIEVHPQICYKISLYGGKESYAEKIDKDSIQEAFLRKLHDNYDREIERGYTMIGPHRDDYSICFEKGDMRFVSSQGEQRTAVIALKLAEIELFEHKRQETPIILFDDVLSELDSIRSSFLLKLVDCDKQVFLSCTKQKDLFEFAQNAEIFEVEAGFLRKISNHSNE